MDPVSSASPARLLALRTEAEREFNAENYAAALPLFYELLASIPLDSELFRYAARSATQLGMLDEAIQAYQRALELGCKFPWEAAYEIARLYAVQGNHRESLVWLEQAIQQRLGSRSTLEDEPEFKDLSKDPRFKDLTGVPPMKKIARDEGWRVDLYHLVQEAQRLHVGPERPAFSQAFLSAAQELHRLIPSLTNAQIYVGLQRLLVKLGDGHSSLVPSAADLAQLHMLPLDFYLFQDGLFVINGMGEAGQWVGWQVLRLGDLPVEIALHSLEAYVPADNDMQIVWLGMQSLALPAVLQDMGAGNSDSGVLLTLQSSQGETVTAAFQGGELRSRSKLMPSVLSREPAPLYLQHVQENAWLQALPDYQAVYVQYNQAADRPELSIETFASQLLVEIQASKPRNLIVDVRHNRGGNNFLNLPLLRSLLYFEVAEPDRRIFLITGRGTFSAAQNFVNWLERNTHPILVGEPSSSRPVFVGESTPIRLPYSRIEGTISTRIHVDSFWGDERPWIAPHIPVGLDSKAYFTNQDPALAAVFQAIQGE
jgi:tetratricopeptide (TPR) repeat protein